MAPRNGLRVRRLVVVGSIIQGDQGAESAALVQHVCRRHVIEKIVRASLPQFLVAASLHDLSTASSGSVSFDLRSLEALKAPAFTVYVDKRLLPPCLRVFNLTPIQVIDFRI